MPELDDLRGKYSGHCYLVGNASNLSVDALSGYCFASNLIARCYDMTRWRAQFYLVIDRSVLERYDYEVERGVRESEVSFIRGDVTNRNESNVVHLKPDEYTDTMPTMLRMAELMGFREITVTGCDFYSGRQLHFYHSSIDPMTEMDSKKLGDRKKQAIVQHAKMIDYANERGLTLNYEVFR